MEKLYNNIILSDNFAEEMSDPQNIHYLKNPPEVIDISVGRQLFVDDFLIEETDLTPEYHKAQKFSGNPILSPEMPWEIEQAPVACPKSGGVWYDEKEKIYKMWYEGGWLHNMCYATSTDGINWDRPDLGLEKGTNKILLYEGYDKDKCFEGVDYLRPDSCSVIIDDNCDSSQRYKLFMRNPGGKSPGMVAVSEDGINFKDFKITSELYDRSTIFYNPFRKKWVYSIRTAADDGVDPESRMRSYRECDDLLEGATWNEKEEHMWLRSDDLDQPNPYIGMKPQLYNVDCIGYESIMLGMFQIMRGPENDICLPLGIPKITELMPMYSRDGYNFSRPSRECIINASMYKGAWDRGYVQSVSGGVIIHGDELWIYYIGFAGDENYTSENYHWTENGLYRNGATGLAKIRRDGFVSMNGNGVLLTRKLVFNGKSSMYINAVGKVSAELYTEDGNLIDTSSIFNGDSTKAKLRFSNIDVSKLNGQVIRIKFNVEGKLYSFGFADENGDFGGAHAAGIAE